MKEFNNSEEKKEKELDDLFNIDNKKIKKTIWKAKIKSIFITVSLSLVLIFVAEIGFTSWKYNKLMNIKLNTAEQIKESFLFSNPNRFVGSIKNRYDFLSGYITANTYKVIEGKVVYTGDINRAYNLKGVNGIESEGSGYSWNKGEKDVVSLWSPESISQSLKDVNFFNELGQRRMIFFLPFMNYKDLYRNDISLLNNIDDKKIAEMAISFDKYYSIEEAEDMMKEFKTTWYWIDTLNKDEKSKILKDKNSIDTAPMNESQAGDKEFDMVVPEDSKNAIGIKTYNCQGQKIENPLEQFFIDLNNASQYNNDYKKIKLMIDLSIDNSNELKINYDKSKLRVGGVVVTGTIKQLKNLKHKQFIKSSTIGVVTNKF